MNCQGWGGVGGRLLFLPFCCLGTPGNGTPGVGFHFSAISLWRRGSPPLLPAPNPKNFVQD